MVVLLALCILIIRLYCAINETDGCHLMSQSPDLNQTRSKLIQLFSYAQAFNNLQNAVVRDIKEQPWILWFSDLPLNHRSIRLGKSTVENNTTTNQDSGGRSDNDAMDSDFILKVSRPNDIEEP